MDYIEITSTDRVSPFSCVVCARARVCVFVFSHIRFIYVYTYDIANAVPLIAQ